MAAKGYALGTWGTDVSGKGYHNFDQRRSLTQVQGKSKLLTFRLPDSEKSVAKMSVVAYLIHDFPGLDCAAGSKLAGFARHTLSRSVRIVVR